MGHTNSTANLSLPQFIGTDKPTWLGDVNGAFSAIDSYAGTNDAAVAAAASDASSAISQAAAAVNTANTANTTAGNASTAANNAVGVANNAVAIVGTVDSKVGLLADLTTTDRTSIVNAINEVNAAVETVPTAAQVTYDNTGSGLTATNVQDAINEVAQGGGGGVGTWTLLGTQTGNTPISEPSDYTEVYIRVNPDDTNCMMNTLLPKISLVSGHKYRDGFYAGSTNGGEFTLLYSSGQFTLEGVELNGTSKLASSTISIYYR